MTYDEAKFLRLVDQQSTLLINYINERGGLSSIEESLELGKKALELEQNHFDVHLLLAQSLAIMYQRKGSTEYLQWSKKHYDIAKRLAHQREDLGEDITISRIENLISALDDTYVGTKPVEFTIKEEIDVLHRVNPTAFFYDTSTNAPTANDYNFVIDSREFSPFNSYGNIPVSGYKGLVSDSVEGVWQGLKIIKGKIDYSFFKGSGRKRKGLVEGHKFGEAALNYIEARKKIFVPTYSFMVENCIEQETLEKIMERARRGKSQFFFDVDKVGDINDNSGPLAHSSVLVNLINDNLRSRDNSLRIERA